MRKDRKQVRRSVRLRVRGKIAGDARRPRVAVFRSIKNIYLQAIDDASGSTIAQVGSRSAELKKKLKRGGGTVEAAGVVGAAMAEMLKGKGVETIVYDRGGFLYHGRVKAAAEAMRKAGLNF